MGLRPQLQVVGACSYLLSVYCECESRARINLAEYDAAFYAARGTRQEVVALKKGIELVGIEYGVGRARLPGLGSHCWGSG